MKIKIISEKNINDNLSILTSDDIFGIYDPEKLFCKASDADKKRASDAIEAAKEAFGV